MQTRRRQVRALTLLTGALAVACTVSPTDRGREGQGARDGAGSAPSVASPSTTASGAAPAKHGAGGDASEARAPGSADAGASDRSARAATPCPPEMVQIGRSCVDAYEAHLAIVDGTEPRLAPFSEPPKKGVRYEARSAAGVTPQPYMSRDFAEIACKNARKRLCTLREWHRACRGPKRQRYPYGPRFQAGKCNSGKAHLMRELFGPDAKLWKYEEHFNSPVLSTTPGFLAETGAHPECASHDGAFDMVGNLHEWVAGMVDEELVKGLEEEDIERNDQPWREGNGIFVGGFFSTRSELGPGCEYITIAHEPSYRDYSTGFRCCKDAEGDAP